MSEENENPQGYNMDLVRELLVGAAAGDPYPGMAGEYVPTGTGLMFEHCTDRLRALKILAVRPGSIASRRGGSWEHQVSYYAGPSGRQWVDAAQHDDTWASAMGDLEALLDETPDPT